ncbi:MAG: hypothetical protein EPO02_10920 [Nitrospirae bacterium]|nr:MAG: hypothetical protein EPO02_10920 [Nitrospirota bacterium]
MTDASRKENRRFGLVMAAALCVLGALSVTLGGRAAFWLVGAAALMAVAAWAAPGLLSPLRVAWMQFARVLGTVNSWIILSIIFAVVVTPVALLMRMFGRSPIAQRPDPARASYWQGRGPEEFTANRMERQF